MSTAANAEFENGHDENANVALPLRNDTFLGVCEAIGQDFGFNPNWLRIAFAPLIIISPLATIGAYLALGGVVAGSRWLFPREVPASKADGVEAVPVEAEVVSEERLAA
jgi:phage shock protein C